MRGNTIVGGIAVEVASGLWPATVNVHVGAPIARASVLPSSRYFWEQLEAVKYHEPVCVTFEQRVAPVRAAKKKDEGAPSLRAEPLRETQNQWRDLGDVVDRHFEALPPGQGVGSPNSWGPMREMRKLQSFGRARDAYCAAHERLCVLKRNQK